MVISVIAVLNLIFAMTIETSVAFAGGSGSIIIAGNGPELGAIERLARAFEKAHLGTFVEIQWDEYQDPIAMVKAGDAHVAVTGRVDPSLAAIPIAWDGIAVVVYSGDPTKEVTSQQVAAIF